MNTSKYSFYNKHMAAYSYNSDTKYTKYNIPGIKIINIKNLFKTLKKKKKTSELANITHSVIARCCNNYKAKHTGRE